MASPVPAKSQPLHNFSLPQLEWKKNHTNNLHRGRRLTESPPHQSQPQRHPSPSLHAAPIQSPIRELEAGFISDNPNSSAHEGTKNSGFVVNSDNLVDKSEKEAKSKIYIRLRKSKSAESVAEEENQENLVKKDDDKNEENGVKVENFNFEDFVEPKSWNFRPRKPLRKPSNAQNGGTIQYSKALILLQSDSNTNPEVKKKKNQKFSIPLAREVIEEDIFNFTGSRPLRKPKKRAKIVQKQLDNLFPGLWLTSVTPDCYKVPDPPIKG